MSIEEKLEEMKNLLEMGLEEKGLETAAELLSHNKYSSIREDVLFSVAEYFQYRGILYGLEEKDNSILFAYRYYKRLEMEFPNSQYSERVRDRLGSIEEDLDWEIRLMKFLYDYGDDIVAANKKFEFINKVYTIREANYLRLFMQGTFGENSPKLLEAYLDDIIVNYPIYKIYAYYYKALLNLTKFEGVNYIDDGAFKFNIRKYPLPKANEKITNRGILAIKDSAFSILEVLVREYPTHSITLDLHLLVASFFVQIEESYLDNDTKRLLEYVVQNDQDKTGIRYLLTRQYLLTHKFRN